MVLVALVALTGSAWAESGHVTMRQVNSGGEPNLRGLSEGQHGTHVHEIPDCGPKEKDGATVPGLAAGGHYDPEQTGRHEGPQGEGHLGDLPVLYVDARGNASRVSWAERLKTADLSGRAIVVHGGGDNYADTPSPLGGGGARVACGVVVN